MWPFNKNQKRASSRHRGRRFQVEPLEDRRLLNADFGFAIGIGGGSNDRDQGHDVAIDVAGNVYATGRFLSTVDFDPGPETAFFNGGRFADAFVSKYDADGNLLWAHEFGADGIDSGSSVALDAANNVYAAGTFGDTVDFDPGEETAELTAPDSRDGYLTKLDSDGNFVWARQMGGGGQAGFIDVAVDAAGNVIVVGLFGGSANFVTPSGAVALTSNGLNDIFVAKLDSNGDAVWARSFGGTNSDAATGVDVDGNGNIVVSGSFRETVDFDPGPGVVELTSATRDVFAAKLDGDGNLLWAKQFSSDAAGSAIGYQAGVDGAGDVYVAGTFTATIDADPGPASFAITADGGRSAFIAKLTTGGDFVWARKLPNDPSIGSIDIDVDQAGSVFATGPFRGTQDMDPGPGTFEITGQGLLSAFIVQLDAAGEFVSAGTVGGDGTHNYGIGIAVTDAGQLATTGTFLGTGDFDPGPGVTPLTSNDGTNDIYIMRTTVPPVGLSIGDRVWIDAHVNGRFDEDADIVAAGVTLTLYRDDGTTVNELDADDTPIRATATDIYGVYRFIGLPPGDYLVQVDESNFEPGGILEGRASLLDPAPPADPDDDVDNDDNGLRVAGSGVVAQAVTLGFGAEPDAEDGNSDTNLTVDFGLTCLTTVTNANDSGPGSLREAIGCANGTPGLDTIDFEIPGAGVHTINVKSPLPFITDAVIIDGTTQAGFAGTPLVELDGSVAGNGVSGLTIALRGGGSTIRGLAINGFHRHGIFISRSDGNRIQQNLIGTDATGMTDLGNRDAGVMILNATGNLVGVEVDDATQGNVISGNRRGVVVAGRLATGNEISGNLIGTDAAGSSVLGNLLKGIDIAGAPENRVGSTSDAAKRNVIGGSRIGVDIRGAAAAQNTVLGNSIGINSDGSVALPNRLGVAIRHDAAENTLTQNKIAGNTDDGVRIVRGRANLLEFNHIGDLTFRNGGDGVEIVSGQDNIVGSREFVLADVPTRTFEIPRSVIRGNAKFGVRMVFGTNTVRANEIRQNGKGGVVILRSTGNVIKSNAIDQHDGPGILIDRSDANQITGNVIGSRLIELGNDVGVAIRRANDNRIGGLSFSDSNSIIGNVKQGVHIYDASTGNRIEGNEIGVTGFRIVCAPFGGPCTVREMIVAGNGRDGVLIESDGNIVGGAADGADNVISGNLQNGVRLRGDGNTVQGNAIGTDPQNPVPVPNRADGVRIESSGNVIGGANGSAANRIAFNEGRGVWISSGTGNTLSRNSIHDNGSIGISLGAQGVTPNDGDTGNGADSDTGANNLQNFPAISAATKTGDNVQITGTLNSTAGSAFTVEFFSSPAADPSGNGEGETFIGSITVNTNDSGVGSFSANFPATIPGGHFVTATATDAGGNTSEFSAATLLSEALLADMAFADF